MGFAGAMGTRSDRRPTIQLMLDPALLSTPEHELERINPRTRRYELGQFFTPAPIAAFMAEAVNAIDPQTVLDPGVGGAALLRAVGPGPMRFGCDIDPAAVELSDGSLAEQGGTHQILEADFLNREAWPLPLDRFDAVICNPPYIRHHSLSAAHKALAEHHSERFGISVSSLSGSYVYFFLEAIDRLREGGRLAFITPTEFLDVRYGRAVKHALLQHCSLEEIVVLEMDELAFDGVLTTSAITIATKDRNGTRRFKLTEGLLSDELRLGKSVELVTEALDPSMPWTALLPTRAKRIETLTRGRTARLGDYTRIRRGIASGDNSFFCLTQAQVDQWGIEPEVLVPLVVGAKDLPDGGQPLTIERWQRCRDAGARCWLLWCHRSKEELTGMRVLDYINHGEAAGIRERFNCRARKPWYSVERVDPPDFFVTYMSRERARFVRNEAGARCMSSLLNLWAKDGITIDDLSPLLADPENARIIREFGRTYGGGLGKIEPGELRRLPVRPLPTRAVSKRAAA